MTSASLHHQLLADTLAQAALNPTMTVLWQAVVDAFRQAPSAAAKSWVVERVQATVPDAGLAGFYRASFLAYMSGDERFVERAAELALHLQPVDPERLLAFLNLHWGMALRDAADHGAFARRLRQARAPQLQRLLGSQLRASRTRPQPQAMRAPGHRVALVVPHLGDANHPPTGMALEQAALLAAQGLEVILYACQEMDVRNASQYLGCGRHVVAPPCDTGWLAGRLPPGVVARIADPRYSLRHRWQEMLGLIDADAPALVMLVGLCSPLMFALHDTYPVLGLGVHALPPLAPVDVWLSAAPAPAEPGPAWWDPALPPAAAHHHPYRLRRPDVVAPMPRHELGVAEDGLLLVTVGARLADEIAGAWAARMLALLDAHPDASWLLVGGDGVLPPALQPAAGRIRCLPHRRDLARIVAASDICVNPPRVGGGLSAAEAMALGVPVVALADGDAGAKLGSLAQPDEDSYFRKLSELMTDRGLRQRSGRTQQLLFDTSIDLAASGPSLLAACALASRRFAARRLSGPGAS